MVNEVTLTCFQDLQRSHLDNFLKLALSVYIRDFPDEKRSLRSITVYFKHSKTTKTDYGPVLPPPVKRRGLVRNKKQEVIISNILKF